PTTLERTRFEASSIANPDFISVFSGEGHDRIRLSAITRDKRMSRPKAKAEFVEGPQAWERFNNAMKTVLAVPHSEIQRRIEEHRKEAEKNPNRRGPKRKA